MKNKKLLGTLFICTIVLFINISYHSANAEMIQPEVEIVTIKEYSNSTKKIFTMQPVPLSVTNVLNFVEKSTTRQPKQLLKYIYPTYSDSQLNSVTANLEQSNKYIHSQGYKTKVAKGNLDINLLKSELSNNRPVLAFLTANGDYWIEQETAVIIFGYQKITFPGNQPQIIYQYKSLNHGNGAIFSGRENEIQLLLSESQIDPTTVSFKWDSTLYGFSK